MYGDEIKIYWLIVSSEVISYTNSYAAARPDSLLVSGVGVQQRNVTRVVTCYSSSNGMFMYKIIHYPLFGHINYMSHVVVSPLCLG